MNLRWRSKRSFQSPRPQRMSHPMHHLSALIPLTHPPRSRRVSVHQRPGRGPPTCLRHSRRGDRHPVRSERGNASSRPARPQHQCSDLRVQPHQMQGEDVKQRNCSWLFYSSAHHAGAASACTAHTPHTANEWKRSAGTLCQLANARGRGQSSLHRNRGSESDSGLSSLHSSNARCVGYLTYGQY